MNSLQQIQESWEANAANWIATIDNGEIESRRLVTDEAIEQTVLACAPQKVLDLGCGEGWLSRRLRGYGINAWGADGTHALIDAAIARGGKFYFCVGYEEIIAGKHHLPSPFDLVVVNFALLDKMVTAALLHFLPQLLPRNGSGFVVIQTLHPFAVVATERHTTGWKEENWKGLKRPFSHPYYWYYRTVEDWLVLFKQAGFVVESIKEPVHPQTQKPVSVIFVLKTSPLNLYA